MKTISFYLSIFLGISLFLSCDKVEELVVVKIPVPVIVYEMKDIPVELSIDGFNTFSTTKRISFDSIEGLTETEKKNLSRVTKIESGSGAIMITSNDGTGTFVQNFTMKSDGVSPDFKISQCSFGTVYTESIRDYADNLMNKAISNGGQDVLVSGKTDLAPDKTLDVKIILKDVVLYAKVIQ